MLRQGDTGDWIGTFEGHKGAVWGVDLNKNATKAATGAADFSAKIWNAVSGEVELTLAHNHIVKSVNFSQDSKRLATGSNDKKLRIFDLDKGNNSEAIVVFEGHTSGIKQVLLSENDQKLLSLSEDRTLRMWDTRTGSEVKKTDFTSPIGGMELSRDGETVTVAHGHSVTFCDAKSFDKQNEVKVPCQVYTASLLKENKVFVCGGEDLKLYKYDYETGQEIGRSSINTSAKHTFYIYLVIFAESFKGHFGPVHCVRFSPDGELYASGSEDGTLRLWQTEVGKTYGLWKCVDTVAVEGQAPKTEAVVS